MEVPTQTQDTAARRTLRAFYSKLREETDLDRLGGELVEATSPEGTQRKRGKRCLRWS
jgi:predicted ATPase